MTQLGAGLRGLESASNLCLLLATHEVMSNQINSAKRIQVAFGTP
jgi:hypothetical protein